MATVEINESRNNPMRLEEAVMRRHTSRRFQPTPVPREKVLSALSLAAHSPSNSNIQPWRMYLVSGAALDRLKSALVAAAASGADPAIPPLPEKFKPLRSELGSQVYGVGLSIPRGDAASRRAAVLRNFDFFGAPLAALVCMDRELSIADSMSVGMYLQTFLLGLTEEGVDSSVEVSVTGYPDVIRQVVGVPEQLEIISGVAIGFEEAALKVNEIKTSRLAIEQTTVFLDS